MRAGHYNNSRTARTSRPSSRTLSQWMLSALTIGITSIAINQADAVNYTESWNNGGTVYNPGTTGTGYWEVATLLDGVFGTADPNTPTFQETSAEVFTVQGTGMQEVDFTFLYDDGGYHFQFGYFVVTAELLAMPTTTIADKQAWAIAALQNAEVVFVDRNYGSQPTQVWDPSIENQEWIDWHFVRPDGTSNGKTWCPGCESADIFETTYGGWVDGPPVGAPDGAQVAIADPDGNVIPGQESFTYSGVRTNANTVTKQFEGGTQIGFFIIPDNTLENFLNNNSHFGVTTVINHETPYGTGGNWPLFSISDPNPGLDPGNTGTGMGSDQVMTFEGTTEDGWLSDQNTGAPLAGQTGTFVAFEDLWKRPNPTPGSWWLDPDSDHSDLVFFVGNVNSNLTPVPEASTWIMAGLLFGAIGLHFNRRRLAKAHAKA